MPQHTDLASLNTALAAIANQNDPVSPLNIGGLGLPTGAPVANSVLQQLVPYLEQQRQQRESLNPDLAAAQRQATVQRFNTRRDPIPPQPVPGGGTILTNQGGPMTGLRQQAEVFQDPNFPAVAAGQREQAITGAINTSTQVLSSMLANERTGAQIASREKLATQAQEASRELAELNQAAATGRVQLTQEQQNRRAQLQQTVEMFRLLSGMEQDFPGTFGFGGPPEHLQQAFGDLQGQVGAFGAPINTGVAQPTQINTGPQIQAGGGPGEDAPIDLSTLQVGQSVTLDDGSTAIVAFRGPDGSIVIQRPDGSRETVQ